MTCLIKDLPQESGYSDSLMPERDSDDDGPTDPERHTEDEDEPHTTKKTKTKTRRRRALKQKEERQGAAVIAEDAEGINGDRDEEELDGNYADVRHQLKVKYIKCVIFQTYIQVVRYCMYYHILF